MHTFDSRHGCTYFAVILSAVQYPSKKDADIDSDVTESAAHRLGVNNKFRILMRRGMCFVFFLLSIRSVSRSVFTVY